jgi:RNA-directed DNA polymerase
VAKSKGDINEMKKSQIQLVQSYAGRALAIKTVSTNKGKSTTGVDGKLYQTPTEKLAAISLLRMEVQNLKNYQGSPVKRI